MPPASNLTAGHLSPEELAAYVQGLPGREDRTRLSRHLAGCPPCYAEMLEVLRLLRGPGAGTESADP